MTLSHEELAGFWALGLPVEASDVPEDEWHQAFAAGRVQEVWSTSSMGTAETGWVRAKSPTARRRDCAVVPPGQLATHFTWDELIDDRDTIAVCWQPLWDQQENLALGALTEGLRAPFLAECARLLVELEQPVPEDPARASLMRWLSAEAPPESAELEQTLAKLQSSPLDHLVRGVRARWLTHDTREGYRAVLASAERGKRDFWGHGNTARQREVRMTLLRFIVRLVRR